MNYKNHSLTDLLLQGIILEKTDITDIDISPCIADPERIKYMAKIKRTLTDIQPTLFLSLPNSRLTKSPQILSFTVKQHNFMLGEKGDLAVTFVRDKDEVNYINMKIIELINKGIKYNITNKINLEPLVEKKKKLTAMKLYELFPKTNCKECGEETCFNYTARIMSGEKGFDFCPYVEVSLIKKQISPIDLDWKIF